jgi:UDP-glucose 4-epimerase
MQIKTIAFASSSAIYGDHGDTLLVENLGPLLPISNYGAMKLASEAIISAAAESFLDQAFIFRFPNVIGTPATHGVMLDFIRRLQKSPDKLVVLGDGTQKKGYLHVEELIDAMLFVANNPREKIEVLNIGSDDDGASVRFIAEETIRLIAPTATVAFGDENRGWVGDVPKFTYSIDKLKNYGWTPKLGSHEAIKKALKQIKIQEMGN